MVKLPLSKPAQLKALEQDLPNSIKLSRTRIVFLAHYLPSMSSSIHSMSEKILILKQSCGRMMLQLLLKFIDERQFKMEM